MAIRNIESCYYNIKTPSGPLHIHINYYRKDNKVIIDDIFLRIPPLGSDLSSLVSILGVFIARFLRKEGKIEDVLKHLNSIKSDKRVILDENIIIDSIPKAIYYAIKDFKEKYVDS